jgi:hypothetical protein
MLSSLHAAARRFPPPWSAKRPRFRWVARQQRGPRHNDSAGRSGDGVRGQLNRISKKHPVVLTIPLRDPFRIETAMVDQEELRFIKKQQWYVATASVTLNAAVIALLKGSQLRDCEPLVACLFIGLVAGFGVVVLWQLQNHMRTLREPSAPWHRVTDVFYLLTFFVLAVAVGVGYCILRPLQALPGH